MGIWSTKRETTGNTINYSYKPEMDRKLDRDSERDIAREIER